MFINSRLKFFIVALFVTTCFFACTKKWDEHNEITNSALGNNLAQTIANTQGLAKFNELLVKSGYDKVIASSKTFTVWAPTDQALQSLDPSTINDSAKLSQFVGNHIANQSYLAGAGVGEQRLQMLNGKYIVTSGSKFDDANIVSANTYGSNGVVHVIDKYIPRLQNIWEYVNSNNVAPKMKAFLQSLNRMVFDPANATQTGINPNTGQPVYDTATGLVARNTFLDSVMNLTDESNQYTLLLLEDDAFTNEFNKLTPWFKTSTVDSTNKLAGYWLVKDLAFKGALSATQLPDTIVSQFGVKIPINKSAIKATYKTSNGVIHLMGQVNFTLANKFPPIIIQGENPTAFATTDRNNNTFYRVRTNPTTGQMFNDILMQNYNFASYYIRYLVRNVPSMRYNASWVAVNDVQTTPLWSQRLGIDSTNNTTNLPAVQVAYQNYNEVPLGQINITNFRNLNLFVIGPTTASSSGGNNSISLDYIKLTPAF